MKTDMLRNIYLMLQNNSRFTCVKLETLDWQCFSLQSVCIRTSNSLIKNKGVAT
jgi:hypothetical protein